MKNVFKKNDKVKLLPFEDKPEEFGKCISNENNGVVMVQIYENYIQDPDDDGLREVPIDQLQKL